MTPTEYNGNTSRLSAAFLDSLDPEAQTFVDTDYHRGHCIDADYIPYVADGIQQFIAETIAGLVNAGSERDAVNEDEELRDALERCLRSWSNLPDPTPPPTETYRETTPHDPS